MAFLALLIALAAQPSVAERCGLIAEEGASTSFIDHAVFTDGRLWLRADSGALFSVAQGERTKRVEWTPGPVIGLCAFNGHIAALTCDAKGWTLRNRVGGKWPAIATFDSDNDGLAGLACADDAVTLVARKKRPPSSNGTGNRGFRSSDALAPLHGPPLRRSAARAAEGTRRQTGAVIGCETQSGVAPRTRTWPPLGANKR